MESDGERHWRELSRQDRLEVLRKVREATGIKEGRDEELAAIDDADDLPPGILGSILLAATTDGWDFEAYRRQVERIRGMV